MLCFTAAINTAVPQVWEQLSGGAWQQCVFCSCPGRIPDIGSARKHEPCLLMLVSAPAAVAGLEEKVGLQQAMLIVPLMYLLSGMGFFFAEKVLESEKRADGAGHAR